MERIIPLFAIASLDHDHYPGVNSRYLTGNAALVNCNLLEIISLLYSKDTRQCALGITSAPPSTTVANRVSSTPTQPPPSGRPTAHPTQPPAQTSDVAYPPPREVPWKCIAEMMDKDKAFMCCHYNHPEYSPRLKFYQEVGCPELAKNG